MRVLALASQKGGSGKTTLSSHLGVAAGQAGAGPVVLIDIDANGALGDWWNARETDAPAFAQTTVARLAADLEVLRLQGFRLAIIDTPPALSEALQAAIQVAELVVVPTRPGAHDLRAVTATIDLCKRSDKPLLFAATAVMPDTHMAREAMIALSQHGTVAPMMIHQDAAFVAAMADGRTVMEIDPEGEPAREVAALWRYVSDRLETHFRRTVFATPAVAFRSIARGPASGFGRRVTNA